MSMYRFPMTTVKGGLSVLERGGGYLGGRRWIKGTRGGSIVYDLNDR